MDASTLRPSSRALARSADGRALLAPRSQLRYSRQRRRAVRRQPTAHFVEHALLAPLTRAHSPLSRTAAVPAGCGFIVRWSGVHRFDDFMCTWCNDYCDRRLRGRSP